MRWKLVFGFGVAGAVAGSAFGQFAVDRVPAASATPVLPAAVPQSPPQALPPGLQPVIPTSPGAYTPPVGGVMPAGGYNAIPGVTTGGYPGSPSAYPTVPPLPPPKIEIESALGRDHPWALKQEYGAYFICVKSYSRPHRPTPEDNGPSARAMAETLAKQIREKYQVQAFLYEYISDERKAEAAALAAERERGRVFLEQLESRRRQSELQGNDYLEPDLRIRYKTVNYRDQIAVLVGGFRSEEDAKLALDKVHTWASPTEKILMDSAVVGRPTGDGKAWIENGYLNPYKSATIVPNPLIKREAQQVSAHLDAFLVKLNEGRPYSLLKATEDWTLAVKSFTAPVEIVGKDTDPNVMRKSNNKVGNALLAGEVQAETMAKMLREMKGPNGQPLGLEAFVLHGYHGSVVTVGQFKSPNDPALIQLQNMLSSMKMNVSEDKQGTRMVANAPALFESRLVPVQIPKP